METAGLGLIQRRVYKHTYCQDGFKSFHYDYFCFACESQNWMRIDTMLIHQAFYLFQERIESLFIW